MLGWEQRACLEWQSASRLPENEQAFRNARPDSRASDRFARYVTIVEIVIEKMWQAALQPKRVQMTIVVAHIIRVRDTDTPS